MNLIDVPSWAWKIETAGNFHRAVWYHVYRYGPAGFEYVEQHGYPRRYPTRQAAQAAALRLNCKAES